jgi:UDPglucose 6-dehydrogenase
MGSVSMKVSVIGLGKLGACMAAAMASRGLEVVGVDTVNSVVETVNAGRSPVTEVGLEDVIAANRERLKATTDIEAAVAETDITFIIVPTPSEPNGSFSLRFAAQAAEGIGRALAKKSSYHLVVLSSTVMPGASDAQIIPVLEAESGKRLGRDFGFCYSPEFIALGSVIRDFLNPDFVLIGESDSRSGAVLESLYAEILLKPAPIARMSCANAELSKIAVNTYVTMKISFANTIAEMCQRLPGGDVDAVTAALGLDSRIGSRYLTGAVGYGGPCFPRDNLALSQFARSVGVEPLLAESTDAVNRRRSNELIELVSGEIGPDATVAVLGLSYKPGTDVVDESQGIALARILAGRGNRVLVHDPLALERARNELGSSVDYCASVESALADASAAVIVNPEKSYAGLGQLLSKRSRPLVVLDCWRILKDRPANANVRYRAVGVAQAETAS